MARESSRETAQESTWVYCEMETFLVLELHSRFRRPKRGTKKWHEFWLEKWQKLLSGSNSSGFSSHLLSNFLNSFWITIFLKNGMSFGSNSCGFSCHFSCHFFGHENPTPVSVHHTVSAGRRKEQKLFEKAVVSCFYSSLERSASLKSQCEVETKGRGKKYLCSEQR